MSDRPTNRSEARAGARMRDWAGDRHLRDTAYDDRLDDVRAPDWAEAVAASAAAVVPAPGAPADGATADEPLAAEAVSGNLRRYARWQWKDFWQRRGFWMAAAALFGVWLMSRLVAENGPNNGPMLPGQVTMLAHFLFAIGGALAGLLGTGGLVARERERGLQRFLFAKPVNIVRYYLQGLAVNGVGSLLVVLGAVLLAALVFAPAVPVLTVFGVAAATYALTSGLTFFVSTLLRIDAPLVAGYLMAGFPAVALAENGYLWAKPLQWLFPQAPMVAIAKAWMPKGPGPEAFQNGIGPLLAVLAVVAVLYGVAGVAGGVAALRRRSIQT